MAASDTSLQLALTYLQELLDSVQQGHSGRAAEIGQSRLTTALAEATNIIELCLRGEDTVEPAAIGSINTDQTTFASIVGQLISIPNAMYAADATRLHPIIYAFRTLTGYGFASIALQPSSVPWR